MSIPKVGSTWRRKGPKWYGFKYTVIAVTERRTNYPVTVVYRGDNGKTWTKPIDRWPGSLMETPKK